jgi:hypothetical protein
MFERIVTALEAVVLGLWAGALAGFAFVFAPLAFRAVPRLDTYATLVGSVVRALGTFGAVCGALAIAAALLRARYPAARPLALVRAGLAAAALFAASYETMAVVPRMEAVAAQIGGPIDSVDRTDPRRQAYDGVHELSTRV